MDETAQTSASTPPAPYIETPVVEPLTPVSSQSPFEEKKQSGAPSFIGNFILFTVLFFAGASAGVLLRQYMGNTDTQKTRTQTVQVTPIQQVTPTPVDPLAGWTLFTMGKATYKLPPGVSEPVCDGPSCVSMGTYLPAGTRFTVASRGPTYALGYPAGGRITDVNGTVFETTQGTVAGVAATEFTGQFRGTTVAGYTFSRMHGFMVHVDDGFTLEINHFTPFGVHADFDADHLLFSQIVKTVTVGTSGTKGASESGTPSVKY